MKMNAVSEFGAQVLFGVVVLLLAGRSLAEDRAEVLERIAPVGTVAVEGKAAEVPETAVAVVDSAAAAEGAGGDQLALATTSGCMACHKIEMKVVGPAYKDVAAKYKDDAAAIDRLVVKVKAGGVGAWGSVPMPPNAHVSDENIRAIVTWLLTL